MNTNDFTKCRFGEKLWAFGHGEVTVCENTQYTGDLIVKNTTGERLTYLKIQPVERQMLYFSNPNIIAPPEPVRLPGYKDGEWVAVWDDDFHGPCIRQFKSFSENRRINTDDRFSTSCTWGNHCAIAELPEVLAKWGEK